MEVFIFLQSCESISVTERLRHLETPSQIAIWGSLGTRGLEQTSVFFLHSNPRVLSSAHDSFCPLSAFFLAQHQRQDWLSTWVLGTARLDRQERRGAGAEGSFSLSWRLVRLSSKGLQDLQGST